MKMLWIKAVLIMSLWLPTWSARADDVISNFNTNSDGWLVVTFTDLSANNYNIFATYGVTYNPTGGNPGGYVSSIDPDGSSDFTFSAPAKFLGNISTATALSYDLTHPLGSIDYQTTDVILVGNGQRLLWKSIPDIIPGTGWTSVNLAFTPSANWRVGTTTGALATVADFQNVLGNTTGLYIRGEFTFGLGEESGLDNVRLVGVAVPEPSSILMLGSVAIVGGIGALRYRRKTRMGKCR